jgi:hypothetical protein
MQETMRETWPFHTPLWHRKPDERNPPDGFLTCTGRLRRLPAGYADLFRCAECGAPLILFAMGYGCSASSHGRVLPQAELWRLIRERARQPTPRWKFWSSETGIKFLCDLAEWMFRRPDLVGPAKKKASA